MALEWLFGWFQDHDVSLKQLEELDKEDNFLQNGLIDSFGFLDLVASAEEEFSFTFSESDFADDRIFSLGGLASFLDEKASQR